MFWLEIPQKKMFQLEISKQMQEGIKRWQQLMLRYSPYMFVNL